MNFLVLREYNPNEKIIDMSKVELQGPIWASKGYLAQNHPLRTKYNSRWTDNRSYSNWNSNYISTPVPDYNWGDDKLRDDLTVKFADEISNYDSVWDWMRARIDSHNIGDIYVGDYIPYIDQNGKQDKLIVLNYCRGWGI